MSGMAGQGALRGLRGGEPAAETPGRCVGPSRSGRGVRRPWGKRWGSRTTGGRGARRRARSSVRETHCVSAERLQDCRGQWGRRQAAGTAQAAGANEVAGTPGTAGSMEAARDPGTVWVNGAVGIPQVVGPVGSVWVTGSGEEEESVYRSPRGCERKGRPGSMGHESILELWLKVQAMRAASGCGEGSRVELHPVPAGEGLLERGIPGRASWVETSRGGLTGPWVKGQGRAAPGAAGIAIALGLGAGCERAAVVCGQGQPVRIPSVALPGTMEANSGIAPNLLGRGQAVGVPGAEEGIDYGVAPGSRGKGVTVGVPGAMGWPKAVEVPRSVEGELGYGGALGLWGREQSVQVPGALAQEAVCGDTPGLWRRVQAAAVPEAMGVLRAAPEETISVGAPALWWRRQAVEETGPGGLPGLWGIGQPVGVPCVIEEGARYGGDPGFKERGQALWVETGSGGDSGSWEATQTAEVSGPDEQEAGSGGAPMSIGQAMGVPRAWGTEQSVGVSQAAGLPGAVEEPTSFGGVPGLWARQQARGVPVADAVPGVVRDEMCGGNVLSLWERSQVMGEQAALVPEALGRPGSVDQEPGCGDASCLSRRRQAEGSPETVGMPEAAGVSKHRCAPAGVPTAVGAPGSGSIPARMPAAVWVSGSVCQESSSRDDMNLWGRAHPARIPVASGVPVAPEEVWPVGEDPGSEAFRGSWGRRQAVGVPGSVAPELPGLVGEETGSECIPTSWGRRQSARVPAAAEVPAVAPRVPGPLGVETGSGGFAHLPGRKKMAGVPVTTGVSTAAWAPRPAQEDAGSGGVAGLWGGRETVRRPTDAKDPTRMGMPATARVPGPMRENLGLGGISGLVGGRQTVGASMAVGLRTALGVPGPEQGETLSGGLLSLLGRRQIAEMPAAASVSLAVGVPSAPGAPGLLVGAAGSGDGSGAWGRREVFEMPTPARASGPLDGETASEGVAGLWRRRPSGAMSEAVSLGMLAAVGVPMAGRGAAAVWVTGCAGEGSNAAISGLRMPRRQSIEGPGASSGEVGGGSVLGLVGRSQMEGVSYTFGRGTRSRSCPRCEGEEPDYENVPGVSRAGTAVGVNEAEEVPLVSREETGIGWSGDLAQQGGRRQAGGGSGIRVRGNNLGETYEGEDRLRGAFQ
ncbi:collagen alpha-2(IV) chain [Phacochoerus africanus]|uniref:collagen alpha-2(IV) chain n=1 Tax=Phacochoerus africanus TaxID=41426 RepID=UPI001FD98D14|nr:collagen alpha-2(IV) chain [Phacochoerus africanus]